MRYNITINNDNNLQPANDENEDKRTGDPQTGSLHVDLVVYLYQRVVIQFVDHLFVYLHFHHLLVAIFVIIYRNVASKAKQKKFMK